MHDDTPESSGLRSRLKDGVHKLSHRIGFDVARYPRSAAFEPRSFPSRRARWLLEAGVTVVVDVGANSGGYARQLRESQYRGRIVSFEPQSSVFDALVRSAAGDAYWHTENLALGRSEATTAMNISEYSESSSLLAMRPRHTEAFPESAYIGQETVRVTSLDAVRPRLLEVDDVVWLKLDVQGYEADVIEGATRTLEQVVAVEMELSLVPLYEGEMLVCESIGRLKELGFQLIAVEEGFQDATRMHTLQLNGIFERLGAR